MLMWTRFIWLRLGSFEHGREPLVSIKGGEFLDRLIVCYTLKKDSAPCTYISYNCIAKRHHGFPFFLKFVQGCFNMTKCTDIELCLWDNHYNSDFVQKLEVKAIS
jgi:hypothetical protein